jgi:hypothetical protein
MGKLPLSHAVAHPLPLAGEGMIANVCGFNHFVSRLDKTVLCTNAPKCVGFNPLARRRERVGERGDLAKLYCRVKHSLRITIILNLHLAKITTQNAVIMFIWH